MKENDFLNVKTTNIRQSAREEIRSNKIAEISLIAHENAVNRYHTIIKWLIIVIAVTNIFWSVTFVLDTVYASPTSDNSTSISTDSGKTNYVGGDGSINE